MVDNMNEENNENVESTSNIDSPAVNKDGKPELTRKQKIIKECISIVLIVVGVFGFRSTFYEPFRIPTGSMIPTLMVGDFIVVDKWAYGFKVPFSDMFGDPVYITKPSTPERGDVVVFKYPVEPSINYIKRVIGLPGDEIEVIDKVVYVNGKALPTKITNGRAIMEDMDRRYKNDPFTFYESKTGEHDHIVLTDERKYFKATVPVFTVPDNQYFMMGDNRDNSSDSRVWGFVPFGHIKGKAKFVWFTLGFPWEENGFSFRPYRIGRVIDWWKKAE